MHSDPCKLSFVLLYGLKGKCLSFSVSYIWLSEKCHSLRCGCGFHDDVVATNLGSQGRGGSPQEFIYKIVASSFVGEQNQNFSRHSTHLGTCATY